MKRITSVCLLLALLLTGCGGVSKEEYDAAVRERDALETEMQAAQTELQELRDQTEMVAVRVTGTFTATVSDLIPDYVTDGETPRMAVVRLFQCAPFTIYTAGLTQDLEVGETYVFEVKDEYTEITREEYETKSLLNPETAVSFYNLWISGFRPAEEKDCGLDSVHLEYEACKPDVRKGWETADE